MTAILPRPAAPSTPDQMHIDLVRILDAALAENANLRAQAAILRDQLGAVVDLAVHNEMTVHRNRAEHPFNDRELADIEALYRRTWAHVCLNAAKEQ